MSANNKVAATFHPHISYDQSRAWYEAKGQLLGEDPDDGDCDYDDSEPEFDRNAIAVRADIDRGPHPGFGFEPRTAFTDRDAHDG